MKNIVSLGLLMTVLFGCSTDKELKTSIAVQQANQITRIDTDSHRAIPLVFPTFPNSIGNDSTLIAEANQQPFVKELRALFDSYPSANGSDWQSLDKSVRNLISKNKHNPYVFLLRQHAAGSMLLRGKVELLKYDSREAKEAIAFYTNQLDLAESDATGLMYFCLNKLRGYWSDKKIGQVAERTVERANTNVLNNKLKDAMKNNAKSDNLTTGHVSITHKYVSQDQIYLHELRNMIVSR